MRKLLPAHLIPVNPATGRPLSGGFFCVAKKNKKQLRLIFDRRPQNATERRLHWLRLPNAGMLRHFVLGPREVLRGSGSDIEVYFFRLEHEDSWVKHNAAGTPVTGRWLEEFGISNWWEPHFVCMAVWWMGDINSADVAGYVHERILEGSGVLHDRNRLEYGKPIPACRVIVGVYLDDLLVLGRVTASAHFGGKKLEDESLYERSLQSYAEARLALSEGKSFVKELKFEAWGAEVDGAEGAVACPAAH